MKQYVRSNVLDAHLVFRTLHCVPHAALRDARVEGEHVLFTCSILFAKPARDELSDSRLCVEGQQETWVPLLNQCIQVVDDKRQKSPPKGTGGNCSLYDNGIGERAVRYGQENIWMIETHAGAPAREVILLHEVCHIQWNGDQLVQWNISLAQRAYISFCSSRKF